MSFSDNPWGAYGITQLNGPSTYLARLVAFRSRLRKYIPSGKNGLPSTMVRFIESMRTLRFDGSMMRAKRSEAASTARPFSESAQVTSFVPGAKRDTSSVTVASPPVSGAAGADTRSPRVPAYVNTAE